LLWTSVQVANFYLSSQLTMEQ